jgi:glycosyltransferase involved in cell wall biosynthesis
MKSAIIEPQTAPAERESVGRLRRLYRKVWSRVFRFVGPKLGVLQQYPPRKPRIRRIEEGTSEAFPLPTISIVMPSFQQAPFLRRSIESVLDQSYPCLEYFVQDGASTDGSLSILREFSERLSGWSSAPDRGQAHAINLAFRRTSGEIMGWLNSDDMLMPGALHFVARYFHRHPHVAVLYGNRILINEEGLEIGRWILPKHDEEILRWIDYVPQETVFWRRSLWEAVGELDESLQFALDWNLLLRFQEAGAQFAHVPQFLGAFRVHPRQKTSARFKSNGAEEIAALRHKQLGYRPSEREVSRRVKWYLYHHLAEHARIKIRHWISL